MPTVKITTKSGNKYDIKQDEFFSLYDDYVRNNPGATVDMYDSNGTKSAVPLGKARDNYRAGRRYQQTGAAPKSGTSGKKPEANASGTVAKEEDEGILSKATRAVKGWFTGDTEISTAVGSGMSGEKKKKEVKADAGKKDVSKNDTSSVGGWADQVKLGLNMKVGDVKPTADAVGTVAGSNGGASAQKAQTVQKAQPSMAEKGGMSAEERAMFMQGAEDVKAEAAGTVERGNRAVKGTLAAAEKPFDVGNTNFATQRKNDFVGDAVGRGVSRAIEEEKYKAAEGYVPEAMRAVKGTVDKEVDSIMDALRNSAADEIEKNGTSWMNIGKDDFQGTYDAARTFNAKFNMENIQKGADALNLAAVGNKVLLNPNGGYADWVKKGAKEAKMDEEGYIRYVVTPAISRQFAARIAQDEEDRTKVKNYADYLAKQFTSTIDMGTMSKNAYLRREASLAQYEEETGMGFWGKTGGVIASVMGDPTLYAGAAVGNLTLKGTTQGLRIAGNAAARKAATMAAEQTIKKAALTKIGEVAPKFAQYLMPQFASTSGKASAKYAQTLLANMSRPAWWTQKAVQGAVSGIPNFMTMEGLKAGWTQMTLGADNSAYSILDAVWNGAQITDEEGNVQERGGGMKHGAELGALMALVGPVGGVLGKGAERGITRFGATATGKLMELGAFMGLDVGENWSKYVNATPEEREKMLTDSFYANARTIIGMGIGMKMMGHPVEFAKELYAKGKAGVNAVMHPIDTFNDAWRKDRSASLAFTPEEKEWLRTHFPNKNLFELADVVDGKALREAAKNGDERAMKTLVDYYDNFEALFADKENVPWTIQQKIGGGLFSTIESARPLYSHYKVEGKNVALYASDGRLIEVRRAETADEIDALVMEQKMRAEHAKVATMYAQLMLKGSDEQQEEVRAALEELGAGYWRYDFGTVDNMRVQLSDVFGSPKKAANGRSVNGARELVSLLSSDPIKLTDTEREYVRYMGDILNDAIDRNRDGVADPEGSAESGERKAEGDNLVEGDATGERLADIAARVKETQEAYLAAQSRAEELLDRKNVDKNNAISEENIGLMVNNGLITTDEAKVLFEAIKARNNYENAMDTHAAYVKHTADLINQAVEGEFARVAHKGKVDGEQSEGKVYVMAQDKDGNMFYVIDGDVENGGVRSESDMVIVVDGEGNIDYKTPDELMNAQAYDKSGYVGERVRLMQEDISERFPELMLDSEGNFVERAALSPGNGETPQTPPADGVNMEEKAMELMKSNYIDKDYAFTPETAKAMLINNGIDEATANKVVEKWAKPMGGGEVPAYDKEAVAGLLEGMNAQPSMAEWKEARQKLIDGLGLDSATAEMALDEWLGERAANAARTGAREATVFGEVPESVPEEEREVFEANRQKYDGEKIEGSKDSIRLTNNEVMTGKYVLTDGDNLVTSHDPYTFAQRKGMPRRENGQSINDRDYEHDKDAQQGVVDYGTNYNERAIQDMPVVTKDGIVVSGNNRTMSGQRAGKEGTDAEYVNYLLEHAEKFGLKREDVQRMIDEGKHPRVVFELDKDVPYTTETYAKFNANDKKSRNSTEEAVKNAKMLKDNPEAATRIVTEMKQYDSVTDLYKNAKSQKFIAEELVKAGIWSKTDLAKYLDEKGNFTRRGRIEFEDVVRGLAFTEDAIRMLDDDDMMAINVAVLRSVPLLIENNRLGDYSIMRVVEASIKTVYDALKSGTYKNGNIFDYFKQLAMDGEGYEAVVRELERKDENGEDVYNDEEKALGVVLSHVLAKSKNTNSVKFLADFLDSYNKQAKNELELVKQKATGQPMLNEPLTKDEVAEAFRVSKLNEKDEHGKRRFTDKEVEEIERIIAQITSGDGPGSAGGGLREEQQRREEHQRYINEHPLTEDEIRWYGGDADVVDKAINYINADYSDENRAAYDQVLANKKAKEDEAEQKRLQKVEEDAYNELKGLDKESLPSTEEAWQDYLGNGENNITDAEAKGDAEAAATARGYQRAAKELYDEWVNDNKRDPLDDTDLPFKDRVAGTDPLTMDELETLGYNPFMKTQVKSAIEKIERGEELTTMEQALYIKALQDVRNTRQNSAADSAATDPTQLGGGNNDNEPPANGGGGVTGGSVGNQQPGQGGQGSKNRQGGLRPTSGEGGNKPLGEGKPRVGGGTTGGGGRKGGGSAGSAGGDVRGQGGGRESGTIPGADGRAAIDAELAAAKKRREEAKARLLAKKKSDGNGKVMMDITGGIATWLMKQGENIDWEAFGEYSQATVETGYLYIKRGVYDFKEWLKRIKNELGEELKEIFDWNDNDVDDFINEMWNSKYELNGETHLMSEWASILGNEAIREEVKRDRKETRRRQQEADKIEVKVCDRDNIDDTLPFLLKEQRDDVMKAETQFFDESHQDESHGNGKGYLFTNGTGTGKTYTGLGIIKRFVKQGKGRVLIVTPTQEKVGDWKEDGLNLDLEITDLDTAGKAEGVSATKAKGEGVVITTYANMRANKALLEGAFDLIVYDESHRLMENRQGTESSTTKAHHMLANRDLDTAFARVTANHPLWIKQEELLKEKERLEGIMSRSDWDAEYYDAVAKVGEIDKELAALEVEQNKVKPELLREAEESVGRTKVVFLSATPFNTRESLDYAEGYLFKYKANEGEQNRDLQKTNFLVENFPSAYERRQGKAAENVTDEDDLTREEIGFADRLMANGVMSGRTINNGWDYSRDFPNVSVRVASEFNAAVDEVMKDKSPLNGFFPFDDYEKMSVIYETLKAGTVIPRIREHLKQGRRIIVFHRRVNDRKGYAQPPFEEGLKQAEDTGMQLMMTGNPKDAALAQKIFAAIKEFRGKYGDLLKWEKSVDYSMPRVQLEREFGSHKYTSTERMEADDAIRSFVDAYDTFSKGDVTETVVRAQANNLASKLFSEAEAVGCVEELRPIKRDEESDAAYKKRMNNYNKFAKTALDEIQKRFKERVDDGELERQRYDDGRLIRKVGYFAGADSKKDKHQSVLDFNDDDSEMNIIVVQEQSGKEGISLHDRSGKHQRVQMSLALPQSPITFIQSEGRSFRIGNESNAIFEYPILGIANEIGLWSQYFNGRAGTTENLALGSMARGLKRAINRGLIEHQGNVVIGENTQGFGGKEFDARENDKKKPYDIAMDDFKTEEQRRGEGERDNTPEPLGYKMAAEWAMAEQGETMMEPSAGEGSIARYFPSFARTLAIEPNGEKYSRLALLTGGVPQGSTESKGKKHLLRNGNFEDLHVGANKADVIILNSSDDLQTSHVKKAMQHLNNSGRMIIRVGKDADPEAFRQKNPNFVPVAHIKFNGEQTNGIDGLLIVDRVDRAEMRKEMAEMETIDLSGAKTQAELFEKLRDVKVPKRTIDPVAKYRKKAEVMRQNLATNSAIKKRNGASANEVRLYDDSVTISLGGKAGDMQFDYWQHTDEHRGYEKYYNLEYEVLSKLGGDTARMYEAMAKALEMTDEEFKNTVFKRWGKKGDIDAVRAVFKNITKLVRDVSGKTDDQIRRYANGEDIFTKAKVQSGDQLPLKTVRRLFEESNNGADKDEMQYLFDKVMAGVEKVGLEIGRVYNNKEDATSSGMYVPWDNAFHINADQWNSKNASDRSRSVTLLHEMTHVVTNYAIWIAENGARYGRELPPKLKEAVDELRALRDAVSKSEGSWRLNQIKRGYMWENLDEFVAEGSSNPEVRSVMKNMGLWTRFKDAIKKILHWGAMEPEVAKDADYEQSNALTEFDKIMDKFLDGFDKESYDWYVEYAKRTKGLADAPKEMRDAAVEEKETATSERGGAVADNPSSDSLFSDGKERLSRYPLTHQKSGAKLRQNTEVTKKNIKKILNKGEFDIKGDDANSIVRSLGRALGFEKSASSESFYRDVEEAYEVEVENEGRTASIRISSHPASGDRFGNKGTDDKVSIVVYKNGEHHTKGEHGEYEEWIFDPSKTSKEEISKSILNGINSLIDNGKFADETATAQKIKYVSTRTDEIIAQAKADGTYMKAPNGKPSKLNEKQWAQTRTAAFKEWFGDWENDPENASKAVDENGEPLVVYHGSPFGGIEVFDRKQGASSGLKEYGTYFTTNKALAEKYMKERELTDDMLQEIDSQIMTAEDIRDNARNNREYDAAEAEIERLKALKEGKVYECYLNIRNPKEFDAKGQDGWHGWHELKQDVGYDVKSGHEALEALAGENKAAIMDEEYDGVVARNISDLHSDTPDKSMMGDVFLVFDKDRSNIKSATDNNGEFNGGDERIDYRTAEPSMAQKKKEMPGVVRKAAAEAIEALGGGGHVHKSYDMLPEEGKEALRKNPNAMGWYNTKTGKVHIYLPNCPTAYEAERTVLHEKVGHEGLRKVVGEKEYNKFLMSVWEGVGSDARHEIAELASKNGHDYYKAVDEWLAQRAEDFDLKNDAVKRSTWQKIKDVWNQMLHKLGFKHGMSEKDIREALWLSRHSFDNKPGNMDYTIRKAAFKGKLGRYQPSESMSKDGRYWGEGAKNETDLFRTMSDDDRKNIEENLTPQGKVARDWYEDALKHVSYLWTEAFQNNGRALQQAYKAVLGVGKRVAPDQDCFALLNQLGSRNQQGLRAFSRDYAEPITRTVGRAMTYFDGGSTRERYQNLEHYVYAKHALERNRVLAVRDKLKALAATPDKKGATETNKDKAERLQGEFDDLRDSLKGSLDSGSITLRDYYAQLDAFIVKEVDGKWDAGKHDVSGISDTEFFSFGTGTKGEYDDAAVIEHVMNTEARMGEDMTEELWDGIGRTAQFVRNNDYESGFHNSRVEKRMEKMFSWYVPLRGFSADTAEDMYYYMHDKGNHVGKVAMKAEGRVSASDSPIETLLAMGCSSIMRGNRNRAKQALVRFVRNNPNNLLTEMKTYYEEKTDAMGNTTLTALYPDFKEGMTAKDVEQAIEDFEADIEARKAAGDKIVFLTDKKTGTPYRIIRDRNKEQHFAHAWINGKDVTIILHGNPRAMQFVNGQISNYRMPVLSAINSLESQLATSKSLTFMARNSIRDYNYATSSLLATESLSYNKDFQKMYWSLSGKNLLNLPFGVVTGVHDLAKKALVRMYDGKFAEPIVEKHGVVNSMKNLFVKYKNGTLDMSNETERYFKEFCENGGMTGYTQLQGVDEWKEEINGVLEEAYGAKGWKGFKQKAGKYANYALLGTPKMIGTVVKAYFKLVDSVNEAAENQARFSCYYASRKANRKITRAIDDAKRVSVNFNLTGAGSATMKMKNMGGVSGVYKANAVMAGLSATVLKNTMWFFNAGVQGMSRTYQIAMGKGAEESSFVKGLGKAAKTKQFYKAMGTFAVAPFAWGFAMPILNELMAAAVDDDDDRKKYGKNPYCQLPEYVRRDNFCMYIGHGRFVMMPWAIETRAMYAQGDLASAMTMYPEMVGDRPIMEQMVMNMAQMTPVDIFGGSKVGSNDLKGGVTAVVTPDVLEGVIAAGVPGVAEGTNVGWTGTPISYVSDWNKKDPKWKHANPKTPNGFVNFAKWANKQSGGDDVTPGRVNLDPSKLEYLFNTYGSGPAKDVNEFINLIANSVEEDGKVEGGKVPVLKAVYRNASAANSMNVDRSRWYAYRKEYEEISSHEKKYKHTGKDVDTSARLAAGDPKLKIAGIVDRYKKKIKKLETKKNKASTRADRELYQDMINERIHDAIVQIDMIERGGKKTKP